MSARYRNLEVRHLAAKLLYDLTQLPGDSSEVERRLGRALTRFLTSPDLTVDALFDDLGPVKLRGNPSI
jgi:hypothetical protein